ncbi:MAG: acyl-CoA thioesterase [Candidatus Gastranaerophilales bacterium]|nr:acyl-CoA thioesterase [Candidatus Gastranaerophilales bacterium]
MEHAFSQKVFYQDTDAYGVVWHGSYLRWLEMGRVLLCEKAGFKLSELEKEDIVLPVAEIDIKYKLSAKLEDEILIETKIKECGKFYVTFHQIIKDEKTNKTYIDAIVKVVAVHKDGKLYRSLPEQVIKIVQ